jgi:hypothetical protein
MEASLCEHHLTEAWIERSIYLQAHIAFHWGDFLLEQNERRTKAKLYLLFLKKPYEV